MNWVLDWLRATGQLSDSEEQRRQLILAQMQKMALQLGQRGTPPPDYQQLVDEGKAMEAAEVVMFVEALIDRAWEVFQDPAASKTQKARALHDALIAGCMFSYLPPLRISVLLSICCDLVRCIPVVGCVLDSQTALHRHRTCNNFGSASAVQCFNTACIAQQNCASLPPCALH